MTHFDVLALVDELTARLDPLAATCDDGKYWDAPESERVQIGSWQVRQAALCPVRVAGTPPESFEASVVTSWRATAMAALEVAHRRKLDPPAAYRQAFNAGAQDKFPWEWIRTDATVGDRAVVGQRAIEFVSGAMRALGAESVRRMGWRPAWEHPAKALRLSGRVDVLLARNDGVALGVFLPAGPDEALRDLLAFEALLSIVLGTPITECIALMPALGAEAAVSMTVDGDFLGAGLEAVSTAASALGVHRGLAAELTPVPGGYCSYCPVRSDCGAGKEHIQASNRRRFGFPISESS